MNECYKTSASVYIGSDVIARQSANLMVESKNNESLTGFIDIDSPPRLLTDSGSDASDCSLNGNA